MPTDIGLVRSLSAEGDNLAVLAVSRPDGTVHASLVKAGLLDDPVTGALSVGVVVAGDAAKLRYLRAALQATAVFHAGFRWVAVEGAARIFGPDDLSAENAPGGLPSLLRSTFVAAGGTHDDWAEFDRAMANERRAAVLVRADRIATNR